MMMIPGNIRHNIEQRLHIPINIISNWSEEWSYRILRKAKEKLGEHTIGVVILVDVWDTDWDIRDNADQWECDVFAIIAKNQRVPLGPTKHSLELVAPIPHDYHHPVQQWNHSYTYHFLAAKLGGCREDCFLGCRRLDGSWWCLVCSYYRHEKEF
jgi:hypothetical protein